MITLKSLKDTVTNILGSLDSVVMNTLRYLDYLLTNKPASWLTEILGSGKFCLFTKFGRPYVDFFTKDRLPFAISPKYSKYVIRNSRQVSVLGPGAVVGEKSATTLDFVWLNSFTS
jgi:hypothetical protein